MRGVPYPRWISAAAARIAGTCCNCKTRDVANAQNARESQSVPPLFRWLLAFATVLAVEIAASVQYEFAAGQRANEVDRSGMISRRFDPGIVATSVQT